MEKEIYVQLILGVLGGKLLKELSRSNDKEQALTKALLYMIYLSQDNGAPAARQLFIQGLLRSFPSLQHALTNHTYPLVDGVKVKVVIDEQDNLQVTIHERYIDKLSKEIENDPSVSQFVPRSFIETLTGLFDPPLS